MHFDKGTPLLEQAVSPQVAHASSIRAWWRRSEAWFSDNCLVATIFHTWVALNIALFAQGCRYVRLGLFELDNEGPASAVVLTYMGRGFGRTLLLNCALVVVPMTRIVGDVFRRTWINVLLPLDNAIAAHKLLGYAVTVGALGHAACLFLVYILRWNNPAMWQGGLFGLTTTFITGAALVLVLAVIFIGSLARIRRSARFEMFWLSHQFFILFYLAIAFHGNQGGKPNFVYWGGVPLLLYTSDRVYRVVATAMTRKVGAISLRLYPTRNSPPVVRIEIPRDPDFKFKAGQYCEVNCPSISATEYHPFTIASAPTDNTLVLFVKAAGNWTSTLYEFAHAAQSNPSSLEFRVVGPFGAPTELTFQFEDVVLVAGGIGATPFLSVLKDIHNRKLRTGYSGVRPASVSSSATSTFGTDGSKESVRFFLLRDGGTSELDPESTGFFQHAFLWISDANDVHKSVTVQTLLLWVVMFAFLLETLQFQFYPNDIQSTFSSSCLTGLDWSCSTFSKVGLEYSKEGGSGSVLNSIVALYWAILQVLFTMLVLLDAVDTGLGRWLCLTSSWLELIFVFLLSVGAVNSKVLFWEVVTGTATLLIFLVRLNASCKGRFVLAPYSQSDIGRLKSCHIVLVNRTVDESKWFLDDLRAILDADHRGLISCELYFTREEEGFNVDLGTASLSDNPRVLIGAGKPHWSEVFDNLLLTRYAMASSLPVVGLFYCGSVLMGREIATSAQNCAASASGSTRFVFKMENF